MEVGKCTDATIVFVQTDRVDESGQCACFCGVDLPLLVQVFSG